VTLPMRIAKQLITSRILPPVLLVVFATLCFSRTIPHLSSSYVGDVCAIDFQGTLQQLWLLQFHHFDVQALSNTTFMTYPTPVNLFAELGFLLDIGLLALLQALLGFVAGYNVAVWLLFTGLGLATWHCGRRFGLSPWFAALSGVLLLSAQGVLVEVAFGRHYQVLSLATATLAFAEWPRVVAGRRFAAVWLGVLCVITLFAHAFTGMVAALVLGTVAFVALWRGDDPARGHLLVQLGIVAATALVAAVAPVLVQMHHLPTGEEGIAMFTGYTEYYRRILSMDELEGMSPLDLVKYGRLRLVPLGLAVAALFAGRRIPVVSFFSAVLILALIIVWGPYQTLYLNNVPGLTPQAVRIPLPYLGLRAVVPYFWRLLWLSRVALFANLAVALLAAWCLAWVNHALRDRKPVATVIAGAVLALAIAQPARDGKLLLPRTPSLALMSSEGRKAAEMLGRVRHDARVKVIYSFPRSLHLQRYHSRPLSSQKWTFEASCGDRSLENCARHFASFVEIAQGLSPQEEIRSGLCHLADTGTTHLLYVPRALLRTADFIVDGASEEAQRVEEAVLKATFSQMATEVDRGGEMALYRLERCPAAPAARASRAQSPLPQGKGR
jgi:hypothetical protein